MPLYHRTMSFEIANLFIVLLTLAIPMILGFFVIYWAVRLAIRHERDSRSE